MENIIIRQRREVTAMGITRVRELCAQGYIDQSGVFRLKRCVGRYGPKEPCKTANPVITNRAASALKAEGDCAERGPTLAKSRR